MESSDRKMQRLLCELGRSAKRLAGETTAMIMIYTDLRQLEIDVSESLGILDTNLCSIPSSCNPVSLDPASDINARLLHSV